MFRQSQAYPTENKPDFSDIFISKKARGVQKKPEFKNLASQKPNWQPCYKRIEENAHEVRKKTFNFLLCIDVQKT